MRSKQRRILVLFGVGGLLLVVVQEVLAVVGRPATPVSAAGVARRSVRERRLAWNTSGFGTPSFAI